MNDYIIQMEGIEKSYGRNQVLHGVDFNLKRGSIHALLGENGTGKTTLMNILAGVIPGDGGKVTIEETVGEVGGAALAMDSRIAFIHQELALINDLNIFENLFLGTELKKSGRLDKKEMYKKAKDILNTMEIDLNPSTLVCDLDASYKQTIEIARALMKEAKVIIMDEPTTALTNIEIEHMFHIMKRLQAKGVSFVFISHKLNEVVEICDSYTVMRDGCVVGCGNVTDEVTEESLACLMVGKCLQYDDLYQVRDTGTEVLRTEKLTRKGEFKAIDLCVNKGEIIGITGLLGDGRCEVMRTVYGCSREYEGKIYVNGKETVMNSIQKAHSNKISYLPRDRKENGIIKDLSVGQNTTISIIDKLKKFIFTDHKKAQTIVDEYVGKLNIKVSDTQNLITSLSGGNQQKVILARALSSDPELVILDNPTQGVDVGAKLEIYSIIMELAKQGVSFVVLSSEAQEVLMLCDRIYVMYHGEIRHEFKRGEANEENIMIAATGGKI
ncbi:sugar ABC transporter ATP-binding protein [Muricomes intestini]|uniref:sugar ABC transporter ATP-binding protein n=1 Tax=Muricomes intestini TaxID=1796634 RepID=UPI002FE0F2A5